MCSRPPAGEVPCLGNGNSAFHKLPAKGKTPLNSPEIKKDSGPSPVDLRIEHRKRTIFPNRQSPLKKMRVYTSAAADQERLESPPFYGFDNSDKTRDSPFWGFDATNVRDAEHQTKKFADFISELQRCETKERLEPSGRESSSSKENNFDGNIPKSKTATFKPCRNIKTSPDSEDERRAQEEADFQLAKKLQAEFDLIEAPLRTRGSRRRQITLDEMLVV